MDCPDFSEFQDILKRMRIFDDKLVYSINTLIPTESFKSKVDTTSACKNLYAQIQNGYNERDDVIKKCILKTADEVKKYKRAKVDNPNDFEVAKLLRAEQTRLRLLQAELSVEEVIMEKSLRMFTEKCRQFYKPDIL